MGVSARPEAGDALRVGAAGPGRFAARPLRFVPDQPLTIALLDEAWRGRCAGWLVGPFVFAVCVLDAHGAAMSPGDVLEFLCGRAGRWSPLSADSPDYWRQGAAIRVREDGHVGARHRAQRGPFGQAGHSRADRGGAPVGWRADRPGARRGKATGGRA